MTTPRTAVGPDLLDRILRMESDLRVLTARTRRVVLEGVLSAYDAGTHTATIAVDGVAYAGIPVSYALSAAVMAAGVSVCATAGVVSFNASTPGNGRVLYVIDTPGPYWDAVRWDYFVWG